MARKRKSPRQTEPNYWVAGQGPKASFHPLDLANASHPRNLFRNHALAAYETWPLANKQHCGNHAILPAGYSPELRDYQRLNSVPWRNKYYINDSILS